MKITRNTVKVWEKLLVIVAAGSQRFLGILDDEDSDARLRAGRPFTVTNVVVYLANMQMQQTPQGLQLAMAPHIMVAYDLMEPLSTMLITNPNHVVFVSEQPEKFKEWMVDSYLAVFDPPLVKTASIIEMPR